MRVVLHVTRATATGNTGDSGYRLACAAAVVAAVALGLALSAWVVTARGGSPFVDAERPVPADWRAAPLVATSTVGRTEFESDDFLMSSTYGTRMELGEMHAEYKEDRCSGGGSSCANDPHNYRDLRFGDPDDEGRPQLTSWHRCRADYIFSFAPPGYEPPHARRCSTVLTLRRTDDGVYVVSVDDPDDETLPLAAFTRSPRLVRPAGSTKRWLWTASAVLALYGGVSFLRVRARRATVAFLLCALCATASIGRSIVGSLGNGVSMGLGPADAHGRGSAEFHAQEHGPGEARSMLVGRA